MQQLSVVIITFNEEKNIERCLRSVVEIADEIIVVDSFSTDTTEEICNRFKVRFIKHKWEGYSAQKNWANKQASFSYVLSLDADEALSEELKNSILEEKKNWRYDSYSFNRHTNYCGHWINYSGWYPDCKIRLWNIQKGSWDGAAVHETIAMESNTSNKVLKGDMLHYSYTSIQQHIEQQNLFSEIAAQSAFDSKVKVSIFIVLFSPLWKFIRNYIFKLGFLDGIYGFVVCSVAAFATFLKYVKLYHLYNEDKIQQEINCSDNVIAREDYFVDNASIDSTKYNLSAVRNKIVKFSINIFRRDNCRSTNKRKKRVLVDLSILKHLHCGFGQIAWNYGLYYKDHYVDDLDITLLLPKKYMGAFGNNVKYKKSRRIYRVLPWLLPSYDVWHSIHQLVSNPPSRLRSKVILTIHDLNYLYEKSGFKINKYHNKVQNKVNRASYITTISHFTLKDVNAHLKLSNKPISVIYNGVEILDTNKAKQPASVSNPATPFFFTIGQVKTKKNFHVLLDLMKLYPEMNLYIAGQDNTEYAAMMKKRIVDEGIYNVFLVGSISTEEKIWLYKNCRAFLFPSLFEGFGLPVIEAMMFGKPVFSSKMTSLEEIGGDYAFFWDDFESLYMKKVIDDNLDRFYTDNNYIELSKQYAYSYDYDSHMNAYFDLYRKI